MHLYHRLAWLVRCCNKGFDRVLLKRQAYSDRRRHLLLLLLKQVLSLICGSISDVETRITNIVRAKLKAT